MSHISKGKRQYLCKLYDADELITFRRVRKLWTAWATEALLAKPILGFTQLPPDTGYYSGCRKLQNDLDVEMFVSIERVPADRQYLTLQRGRHRGGLVAARAENGSILSTLYDPAGNILAYDFEANMFDHTTDAALLALGFDQLADLNIADTYPKTIEVMDEVKLDRLLDGIKGAPGA